jgi:hypothetical protein
MYQARKVNDHVYVCQWYRICLFLRFFKWMLKLFRLWYFFVFHSIFPHHTCSVLYIANSQINWNKKNSYLAHKCAMYPPALAKYLALYIYRKQSCSLNVYNMLYFIEGWSILQHDLNNIQEVLHFEHCINLWCKYRFSPKTLASNISM